MSDSLSSTVYQLKVVLLGISPLIWRRILVDCDSTIAELHSIIQVTMGWSNSHLHRFIIHGKQYGIAQPGGLWFSDDPTQVKLSTLGLRLRERFLYEYDLGDQWQHQIRVEAILPGKSSQYYPVCVGGKRCAPPEGCGGVWQFMALRQHYSIFYLTQRYCAIFKALAEQGMELMADHQEELLELQEWSRLDDFDRHQVNERLQQYANGEQVWLFTD
jgi:hypothetical protein